MKIALMAMVGIFWFKESIGVLKVASRTLIILGVIGLSLSVPGHGWFRRLPLDVLLTLFL
ncbi:MAG: hypothetical protein ABFC77_09205 [Thermoguttaceae bacterium]